MIKITLLQLPRLHADTSAFRIRKIISLFSVNTDSKLNPQAGMVLKNELDGISILLKWITSDLQYCLPV
jgi:hypothetical protein